MSEDHPLPEESPESPPLAEASAEVSQIQVTGGGMANVAGRDIHIHYAPQSAPSPINLSQLRHLLTRRGAPVLTMLVLVMLVLGIWLG